MNMDDKKNIERLFDLGNDAFISKDYEKAIKYLDEVIDIYNRDIIAYSDSEFIIYSDSYDNEDEEEGKNINDEDINNTHNILVDTYYNRGLSYFNLKNYEEAIKDFDKVIELSPEKSNAYYNRGHSKSYLGKYEEGIKDFKKVLEFNEDDAEAIYYIGLGYFYLGRYQEAIKNFDIALLLDDEIDDAYYYRGHSKDILICMKKHYPILIKL
ncbi:tetratricopeptide repeat protein [Brachyspira hyodysenteriae]|uniref:tetratricopeptide repeat protein n=1 Tax=Brachyspira hyodysenteriae TaxID=159 RepID=UPI0022CDDA6F|nr:tetratricopeptide repeat protein [Brachyspira hyodysenteriae]MCZ9886919.1 tetratricopeptide repeat protein [Brachyspira hyodysenteriae]